MNRTFAFGAALIFATGCSADSDRTATVEVSVIDASGALVAGRPVVVTKNGRIESQSISDREPIPMEVPIGSELTVYSERSPILRAAFTLMNVSGPQVLIPDPGSELQIGPPIPLEVHAVAPSVGQAWTEFRAYAGECASSVSTYSTAATVTVAVQPGCVRDDGLLDVRVEARQIGRYLESWGYEMDVSPTVGSVYVLATSTAGAALTIRVTEPPISSGFEASFSALKSGRYLGSRRYLDLEATSREYIGEAFVRWPDADELEVSAGTGGNRWCSSRTSPTSSVEFSGMDLPPTPAKPLWAHNDPITIDLEVSGILEADLTVANVIWKDENGYHVWQTEHPSREGRQTVTQVLPPVPMELALFAPVPTSFVNTAASVSFRKGEPYLHSGVSCRSVGFTNVFGSWLGAR